jgi:hypothetical protein
MLKKRVITVGFILIIIVLGAIFYSTFSVNKSSSFTSFVDESSQLNTITLQEDLSLGQSVILDKQTQIEFILNEKSYRIRPIEINPVENKLVINLNQETLTLYAGKEKRLELDDDGSYDISIQPVTITSSEASLYLISISEEIGILDSFYAKIGDLNNALRRQLVLIIGLIVIIFLMLFYYFYRNYLFPFIKIRKAKSIKKESDLFYEILEKLKTTENKEEREELVGRAKNLYKYLSDNEKRKISSCMIKIERYIK